MATQAVLFAIYAGKLQEFWQGVWNEGIVLWEKKSQGYGLRLSLTAFMKLDCKPGYTDVRASCNLEAVHCANLLLY